MKTLKICDLHCDTVQLWQMGHSLEDTDAQVNLPYLIEAGVGLQVFAAFVPASLPADQRFSFACRGIDRIKSELERHSSHILLCRSSREVEAAVEQGKIAAVLAVENGDAIEEDLNKLEQLHRIGVRLMTLIHTASSNWVISSRDEKPAFDGLSGFGEEVVKTMNDLGMIIDVSHAHDRAVERVLKCSRAPIIASHSCMHALCPMPRNLKDELIRGIAEAGGVVGINFMPAFLDCGFWEIVQKRGKVIFKEFDRQAEQAGADAAELGRIWLRFVDQFKKTMADKKVPLDKLFQHVEYLVDLVGEDYAAFGSDFDGIPDTPVGVEDCRGFNNILRGLRDRGYSEKRLQKICWGNFLRVLKAVCG